jgi:hypothetical protein
MANPQIFVLICAFCHEPVDLETSKADENGNPVHEDCYVDYLNRPLPSQDSKS